MPDIKWTCLPFAQLSLPSLYALLRLRADVFIVEQNCVYQDLDNYDQQASHLFGQQGEKLIACARLLAPGVKYPSASIGRVATAQGVRGTGSGRALMQIAISHCTKQWPEAGISISAQAYLESFYNSLGFKTVSAPYMEDGIPHIEMHRESRS